MNNRLQVGGLALIINSIKGESVGMVVTLVEFFGDIGFKGQILKDCWKVQASKKVTTVYSISGFENKTDTFYAPSAWLLPLCDDAAIELYKLKEELTCKN